MIRPGQWNKKNVMDISKQLSKMIDSDVKPLLRFLTCGNVDDGKSTLIGRLLYDAGLLFDDQLAALESDSHRYGTVKDELDFALLLDGLLDERAQGITIDVAYRYFSTDQRHFIVADCPGHAQYTRNMATGASTADAALLLVDVRHGLTDQTRRHALIADLFGIRHLALAVNKMDLVDFEPTQFQQLVADFKAFADQLHFSSVTAIPVCARAGDNVRTLSPRMGWYGQPEFAGKSLFDWLHETPVGQTLGQADQPLRLPVQLVTRQSDGGRSYAGTIAAGTLHPGQEVLAQPSGQKAKIQSLLDQSADSKENAGQAGDAVRFTLDREIDLVRGNVLCPPDMPAQVSDQLAARLIWMDDEPLLPERRYQLKLGTQSLSAAVSRLKYQLDPVTLSESAATILQANEIGGVNLSLDRPVVFAPYAENRRLGGFILIDQGNGRTLAAGMIEHGLRRAETIPLQAQSVKAGDRVRLKGQKPCVLWFTGLSGAGKSTIANLVEQRLNLDGRHTMLLDGDNIRHGLNRDLGFTDADRVENIRRIAEVSRLMVEAGLIVLTAFISPFRSERQLARDLLPVDQFIEIHVDAPLAECERRDVKGLYARARAGDLPNFTGLSSPYEPPEKPDLHIDSQSLSPEEAALRVLDFLSDQHYIR